MKLQIKWVSIEVENEDHALFVIEKLESVLNNESPYFQWDYEIEE